MWLLGDDRELRKGILRKKTQKGKRGLKFGFFECPLLKY